MQYVLHYAFILGSIFLLHDPITKRFSRTLVVDYVKVFYPPEGGPSYRWSPMGSQFDLFLSYIYPKRSFFNLNLQTVSGHFWPQNFFIPRRWSYWNAPYGVPFESLSLLYLPLSELFWPSIYRRYLLIFDPPDFLSPGGGATVMLPTGSHLSLFLFYIYP